MDHGAILVRLCDAIVEGSTDAIAEVRAEAIEAMGVEATVDAVAVSALFHLMNRVANGTGTPLDSTMVEPALAVSGQIGADQFLSHSDTVQSR